VNTRSFFEALNLVPNYWAPKLSNQTSKNTSVQIVLELVFTLELRCATRQKGWYVHPHFPIAIFWHLKPYPHIGHSLIYKIPSTKDEGLTMDKGVV
jgi:hypothetical protein